MVPRTVARAGPRHQRSGGTDRNRDRDVRVAAAGSDDGQSGRSARRMSVAALHRSAELPGFLRAGPAGRPGNGNAPRHGKRGRIQTVRHRQNSENQSFLVHYDPLRAVLFGRFPVPEIRHRTDDPEIPRIARIRRRDTGPAAVRKHLAHPIVRQYLRPMGTRGYDHADRLGAAGLRIHSVRNPGAHGKLDGRRAGTGTRSRPFAGAVGHVAFGDENRPVPDAGHLLFDDFLDTELGPGLRPAVDRRRAQEPLHHRHRRDRRRGIHALRLHAADADLRRIRGAIDRLRAAAAP